VIEPDDATWDAFTQSHPGGHLLQSSGWGALKARFGWDHRRLIVADRAGPRAGAQLLFRRRLGFSVAYVPRGPLFAGDSAIDSLLLAALERLARRNHAVFLRLEPNLLESGSADALHSALLLHGFQTADPIQPRSSIQLDLTPTPERLLAAMSKGHRADIRRAEREGVRVRAGTCDADLGAFYAIMEMTSARAGFAVHSRDYYRAAWEQGLGQGYSQLLLAEHGDTTVAAFLVFCWAGAGLYLYSGATESGLKSGANHALQWQALLWARQRGCVCYDFWGIPDALGRAVATADPAERAQLEQAAQSDPLFGVFRFKKGFGGRVVRYMPAYDRIYIPALYALWRRRFGG
jgi:lipid II:glycine glycyltransferase (peptidoglycan interpeptide bridge formation enzyme)